MARTIKEQEYTAKRKDILDAAQRLVFSKGYERMTVGDILADLKISSGAFYHYFDSKPALLEALVERMQQQAEQPLLPIVHDPALNAPEKLRRFFSTLEQLRAMHKTFLAGLARVWYADENAIVRQKVDEVTIERRGPLISAIVRQGVQEGAFATPFPDQVGKVIQSMALSMGDLVARLLLTALQEGANLERAAEIAATCAAYLDAMERTLGATTPFLDRPGTDAVLDWLSVPQT